MREGNNFINAPDNQNGSYVEGELVRVSEQLGVRGKEQGENGWEYKKVVILRRAFRRRTFREIVGSERSFEALRLKLLAEES